MAVTGYSRIQIRLHWLMAILIVAQFVLHEPIVEAWQAISDGGTPAFNPLVASHVIGGLLVLLLGIWRLAIRHKRGVPALPEKEHVMLKGLAHLTHWSLYALMIIMPITGAATWFGGNETADTIHTTLKFPLLLLVVVHVAGALFQQFILKTHLINRMMKADTNNH